jgi:hypothetical protein
MTVVLVNTPGIRVRMRLWLCSVSENHLNIRLLLKDFNDQDNSLPCVQLDHICSS